MTEKVKKGDFVKTPRFLTVKIAEVLTPKEARAQGFNEPTHYKGDYEILGKSTGLNTMIFAAVMESKNEYKKEFVNSLERVLIHAMPSIKKCEYQESDYGEMVIVTVQNGHSYKIDVTADSLIAIIADVANFMKHK